LAILVSRRLSNVALKYDHDHPAPLLFPFLSKLQSLLHFPLSRPLQPLAIHKHNVLEWPSVGCDDLGDWYLPPTPRGSSKTPDSGSGQVFQFKKEYYAFYDMECLRIMEHVYLGSDTVAKSVELLRRCRRPFSFSFSFSISLKNPFFIFCAWLFLKLIYMQMNN